MVNPLSTNRLRPRNDWRIQRAFKRKHLHKYPRRRILALDYYFADR